MTVGVIVRVLAYGVPALLIVLGFVAYTGGKFAEAIFGTAEEPVVLGISLIFIGVLIYVAEIFLGIR